jgi:hypothetical protein
MAMRRVLLILLANQVGVLTAAPAPGPEFIARGYLTREDLGVLSAGRSDSARLHGVLTPGVYLYRSRYQYGEPIPAWFVIRNHGEAREVDVRLDFHAARPMTRNSVRVHLTDLDSGRELPWIATHVYSCGGRLPLEIPRRGAYVVCGNLGQVAGRPLPAGRYSIRWSMQKQTSNTATFTVRPGPLPPTTSPARPSRAFLELRCPEARGDWSAPWTTTSTHPRTSGEVAAVLALGLSGRWYPDPKALRDRDEQLVLTAEWVGKPADGRLKLTVAPRWSGGPVLLPRHPRILLQYEASEEADPKETESQPGDQKEIKEIHWQAPQTLEITLPVKVRPRLASPEARLAVLLGSHPFEMPRESRFGVRELSKEARGEQPWAGVLRATVRPEPGPGRAGLPEARPQERKSAPLP